MACEALRAQMWSEAHPCSECTAGARGVQWDGIATGGRCWPGLGAWQLHVVLTFAEQLPEFAVIFTAELNIQCFSE